MFDEELLNILCKLTKTANTINRFVKKNSENHITLNKIVILKFLRDHENKNGVSCKKLNKIAKSIDMGMRRTLDICHQLADKGYMKLKKMEIPKEKKEFFFAEYTLEYGLTQKGRNLIEEIKEFFDIFFSEVTDEQLNQIKKFCDYIKIGAKEDPKKYINRLKKKMDKKKKGEGLFGKNDLLETKRIFGD